MRMHGLNHLFDVCEYVRAVVSNSRELASEGQREELGVVLLQLLHVVQKKAMILPAMFSTPLVHLHGK
jgi:hypothetical protein